MILKFNLVQTKLGRRILGGSFYLMQPRINGVGSYWTTTKLTKYGDKILEEEHYERITQ